MSGIGPESNDVPSDSGSDVEPGSPGLYEFMNVVGRLGVPLTAGSTFNSWQRTITGAGGELLAPDDNRPIGRVVGPLPVWRGDGIKVVEAGASVLGEVAEFAPDVWAPVARAHLSAELYDNPACEGKRLGLVWLAYRMAVRAGRVRCVIGIDLTARSPHRYPLRPGVTDLWNLLGLDSLVPPPTETPLHYNAYEGSGEHVLAMARYIVRTHTQME
jgi:hypothetical protein